MTEDKAPYAHSSPVRGRIPRPPLGSPPPYAARGPPAQPAAAAESKWQLTVDTSKGFDDAPLAPVASPIAQGRAAGFVDSAVSAKAVSPSHSITRLQHQHQDVHPRPQFVRPPPGRAPVYVVGGVPRPRGPPLPPRIVVQAQHVPALTNGGGTIRGQGSPRLAMSSPIARHAYRPMGPPRGAPPPSHPPRMYPPQLQPRSGWAGGPRPTAPPPLPLSPSPSTTATTPATTSDDAAATMTTTEGIEDVGDGRDGGVQIGPDNPMAHLFDEWYACWDTEVRRPSGGITAQCCCLTDTLSPFCPGGSGVLLQRRDGRGELDPPAPLAERGKQPGNFVASVERERIVLLCGTQKHVCLLMLFCCEEWKISTSAAATAHARSAQHRKRTDTHTCRNETLTKNNSACAVKLSFFSC